MRLDPDDPIARALLGLARGLSLYHRHRVLHLDRLVRLLREGRRVVVVGNHALDVVDPLLLVAAIYRKVGRVPRFIAHENGWFRVPLLREISRRFEVIPARRPEETLAALRRDGFLMLYPGGMQEAALRRYREEPYRLKWQERTGFLRIALEAEAELVFVAAVGAEEAYYQSSLPMPGLWIQLANAGHGERYRGMPLRFGLAGPHLVPGLLPLPVRLTHAVSPPLDLGDRSRARRDPSAFADLHGQVSAECQKWLDACVSQRDLYADRVDRGIRAVQGLLHRFGV
jgi:1-acyl-sn-glycerol-3-phosphate acyltransferase